LLTVVWLLAAAGVAIKATRGIVWPRLSTALYLGMGWLALVAARPFMREVPLPGLLDRRRHLAYTAGVAFFAADHGCGTVTVWHLFVLTGTFCHYVAVLQYARHHRTKGDMRWTSNHSPC
jgi:hemolysin III